MEALELTGPHFMQEYYIEATAAEKPLIVLYMLHHLKFRNVLCFTKTLEDTHRLVLPHLGHVARNPVFGVSIKASFKRFLSHRDYLEC